MEPHPRHCFVSLSKNINPSLVLVQPRKTRSFITDVKNQIKQNIKKTINVKQAALSSSARWIAKLESRFSSISAGFIQIWQNKIP